MEATITPGLRYAAVLVIIAAGAAAVAGAGRLGVGRQVVTASVRAAVQLGAVSRPARLSCWC